MNFIELAYYPEDWKLNEDAIDTLLGFVCEILSDNDGSLSKDKFTTNFENGHFHLLVEEQAFRKHCLDMSCDYDAKLSFITAWSDGFFYGLSCGKR